MKENLSDLTLDELKTKKIDLSEKLRKIRFELVLGHVENPLEKKNLRRSIARVNTLIRQHEIAAVGR
ncbi:MAG: 50S ribosomal protein L29 [Spirochaetaceae bacterium]|jgi:large subunit ribosomal protein L29|nr:50S ribosomal protein L29 [Spirochaetaceae bacterium]